MKKRILALLLCLCMAATFLPGTAGAMDVSEAGEESPVLTSLNLHVTNDHSRSIYGLYPELSVSFSTLATTNEFTYPFQMGKTGYLSIRASIGVEIKVLQDGTTPTLIGTDEIDASNEVYAEYYVSLDRNKTISIQATKADQSTTYSIALGELDLTLDEFSIDGDSSYKIQPVFSKEQTRYAVGIPGDAESIQIQAATGTGKKIWAYTDNANNIEADANNPSHYSVPLQEEYPNSVRDVDSFHIGVSRDNVTQYYNFTIVRSTETELSGNLFRLWEEYDSHVYDGQQHTDLVESHPALDPNKLTITYVEDDFPDDKLSAITDAGWYRVYVSYEGDDVFPSVTDQKITYRNGGTLTVIFNKATAVATDIPTGTITLEYDPRYDDVDLPGIKVTDGKGNELPGHWCLFSRDSTQGGFTSVVGETYEVDAYYFFDSENNCHRNWTLDAIPLSVTITKRILTENDINLTWNNPDVNEFVYNSLFGDFPDISNWGNPLPLQRGLYTTINSFFDKDGNEIPEGTDGVKFWRPDENTCVASTTMH